MNASSCPALLVSGCASGQGKTTVTAALARYHSRAGCRVRVFKTGPDFIDPMVLEAASAAPVYNLDCWMVGIEASRALLATAAAEADLILVEGAMGLYDGEPSTADLAATFGLPVVVVIDANAMAQTFGAVAKGLKEYRPVPFAGVIANRVAGSQHAHMLAQSLPPDIELIAALSETANSLPERHLGLVQAVELTGLPVILDELADLLEESGYTRLPPPVAFASTTGCTPDRLLEHYRVAVARDAAFSFLYRANLDCLAAMGAELLFFSPLADEPVPPADALYLPGGYPELHAGRLATCSNVVNGIDTDAVHTLIDDVDTDPAKGMTHWRVASAWQGGTHSRAQVSGFAIGGAEVPRRFAIDIDEPLELGGGNAFANPQEYLLAALNACMIVGYTALCSLQGITLQKLEITTEGDIDLRGFLGLDPGVPAGYPELRTRVVIKGDGTEEQFRKIHELVLATSPNFYNVSRAVPVVPALTIE